MMPRSDLNNYFPVIDQCINKYKNNFCMVIEGDVYYKNDFFESKLFYLKKLFSLDFYEVIMFNLARHPQYTGNRLSSFQDNPYMDILHKTIPRAYEESMNLSTCVDKKQNELLTMQCLADKYGCSKDNNDLFLVKHIFCDAVSKYSFDNDQFAFSIINGDLYATA